MSSHKLLLLFLLISSFFVVQMLVQARFAYDHRLHIVVCDVGQGEGIYIRTPNGANILFDAGPDESILGCLSKYMPFWERKIELVMLSHPHADHYTGFSGVLKRYHVKRFITEDVPGNTAALEPLHALVSAERIAWGIVYEGDTMRTSDGVSLRILGPTKAFLESKRHTGIVDPSDASLQVLISYGQFNAFLSGDSNLDEMEAVPWEALSSIEMLQTPHHGSKNGLSAHVLERIHPSLASISVGKNNYGHPSPVVLTLYKDADISYRRTDQEGDLRLSTDGKSYNLR